ncbi:MAG: response regulator [Armatimonadetes bacterium]|nr:response regulator [Armatimonadota bacterium]
MKWINNLSIKGKIISLVILLVIFELVISLVGIYYLNRSAAQLDLIVDIKAENIKLAARINRNLVEIHRAEKNLLLSDTKEEIDKYSSNNSEYRNELNSRLIQLKSQIEKQNLGFIEKFERSYTEFIRTDDEVRNMVFYEVNKLEINNEQSSALSVIPLSNVVLSAKHKSREAYDNAAAAIANLVNKIDEELELQKATATKNSNFALTISIIIALASIVIGLLAGFWIARLISSNLKKMVFIANDIADGRLDTKIEIESQDETGKLAEATIKMQASLLAAKNESEAQEWLKTGILRINDVMRGELDLATISTKVISEISTYLDAQIGAFYLYENITSEPTLTLLSSYAYQKRKNLSNKFKIGEGLVGQAALEKTAILLKNVPEDYIKITSGLGERIPQFICVIPFLFEGKVKGVIEIGTLNDFTDLQMEYLEQAMATTAINIETIINIKTAQKSKELAQALAKSQVLTEELQSQQEELRTTNEELEEQTQLLQQSEEKLKTQQEELEVSNEELEEKNESLQRQKKDIEDARKDIEIKAEELAIASKYKSEFLANMSHELRTPLNSLLILSKMLAENKEGNMDSSQKESAEVIYKSGNDLLQLINEILDLSKIEAGRMDINLEKVKIKDIAENISNNFKHMLEEKGLSFKIEIDPKVPESILNDSQRLLQIIKNLMSNAVKFTKKGGVTVKFHLPHKDVNLSRSGLSPENSIAIAIKDSGIGISPDKQKIVFEAFQQAEGGTSRKYGGTGLGLSISRELAHLLGGEIQVKSEKGKGSTFTLYLPQQLEVPKKTVSPLAKITNEPFKEYQVKKESRNLVQEQIPDDRESLKKGEKSILIIEDDAKFAKLLLDQCRLKGFNGLVALTGEEGLELAEKHLPAAVILDLHLPGIDGWGVLDTLKNNSDTRHIPVHIVSVEDSTIEAFRKGAIGYLTKPVKKEELDGAFLKLEEMFSRRIKDLLVVVDNKNLRENIIKLIGNGDVHCQVAVTGAEAITKIETHKYDCVIFDLGLPNMTGFQLLKTLEERKLVIPPVIIYTGKDLTKEEEFELRNYAESIVIKGVKSEERLLDETSLFLHRMVDKLPKQKRKMIADLYNTEVIFKGKKVLIVDDDMRNVFALSKLLSEKGFNLLKAEDGLKALEILKTEPDIDLVLMDIMMPEMDGYETIRRIRAQEKFYKLPIIALTAKAMKKDYEDCIAVGASDYLPKPVDVNRLFSMMRVWLYR